jgi:hypothetical protein
MREPLGSGMASQINLSPAGRGEPSLPAHRFNQKLRCSNRGVSTGCRQLAVVNQDQVVGAQFVRETKTLSEDDLPSRASAILKAKNRLPADGAKLVEDAFAGRMGRADAAWEALATPDICASRPTRPNRSQRPPSPSSDQGGRPRKVVNGVEPFDPSTPLSKPTIDDRL